MRLSAVVFTTLLCLTLMPALSFADDAKTGSERIRASLLADTTAIEPGKPFRVGIVLDIDKGWHTYWINPGDSGIPPIVKWKLPPGFVAGEIQWPTPKKFDIPGNMVNFGYDGRIMLIATITPPENLTTTSIDLAADVNWLVCTDEVCLPGDAAVTSVLPLGKSSKTHENEFAAAEHSLPAEMPAPASVRPIDANQREIEGSYQWELPAEPADVNWFLVTPDDVRASRTQVDADAKGVRVSARLEATSPRGIVSREIYTVLGYTDSTGARRGVVLRFPLMPK